ncbi:AMP-binding protein [Litchfieldia salsa]|uniref:Fatty-acyl-CoA synthase n=1 Tax=Litchfieldia salsa TaxID=930152 RepID=A0A1H0S1D5_9BACI|nr:AMP-binding protein [Litchfieldia salsa]SDP35427.1 fatty-acyl-CoA synthase [Litchfieldia salsa]
MFYVNDQYYTLKDLETQYRLFEEIPSLRDCKNHRLAVCLSDAFQWLALCLYLREKGASVLPIHPSTPKGGAIRMAMSASRDLLLFQTLDSVIELTSTSVEHETVGGLIQMSSGTTGEPKLIERTWSSIEEELQGYVTSLSINRGTPSIVACPITHSYGLISGVLACLKRGVEPIIITNMNPKYLIKKLKQYPKHILYATPTLLHTLSRLMNPSEKLDCVMTSGTLMPLKWLNLISNASKRVLQQYGCSEAGCVAIRHDVKDPNEMGVPLPHLKVEAGVVDLPGEIVIHTSEKIIYTRDLGYIKEGILVFLSRIDDTINVAGLNVYPQEVENVLMDEPRITEAVVYKIKNELSGERVCALYVSNDLIEESELRDWCSRFLAPHQIPILFRQVEEIDKLQNGKISRKQLSGLYR